MWCRVLALALLLAVARADDPIVQTKYGPIRGLQIGNHRRFQGVPFAAPPLPPLRWKNPQPPGLWGPSPLDCRNFTIGCAQNAHSLDVPTNKSEDCLYLEIYAPMPGAFSEKASVLMWMYGGDWKEGGESFVLYNGRYLAETQNVMLVAINYRLAVWGFLMPPPGGDANVGLADQRFALKWISENAAYFGADPSRVAIAGQSAGGESVLIHLSSPNDPAASLFHAAIVESGPLPMNFKWPGEAKTLAVTFAINLGCPYTDFNCYQSKNTTEVMVAMRKTLNVPFSWSDAIQMWAPVVLGPGSSLEMQPIQAFQRGHLVKVPILSGANLGDGLMFGNAIGGKGKLSSAEYIAIVTGWFNGQYKMVPDILARYTPHLFGDNKAVLSQLVTDYVFMCGARYSLRLANQAGIADTYLYQFSRVQPQKSCFWPASQQYCCAAVCHGAEIPYAFHDAVGFPFVYPPADLALSTQMAAYWASMVATGSPNQRGANVTWPRWNAQTMQSLQLAIPISVDTALQNDTCTFWDSVGYLTEYNTTLIDVVMRKRQYSDRFYLERLTQTFEEVCANAFGPALVAQNKQLFRMCARLLYYGFTSLRGQQTLGEEYCDVALASSSGAPPSALQRIVLLLSGAVAPFVFRHYSASPLLAILKALHLGVFYMDGLFLHWSKRIAGLRYALQHRMREDELVRPSYAALGALLLLQGSIRAAMLPSHYGLGADANKRDARKRDERDKGASAAPKLLGKRPKCALCFSARRHPTATPCGHVFCFACVTEWAQEKLCCPLCRAPTQPQALIPLYHYL